MTRMRFVPTLDFPGNSRAPDVQLERSVPSPLILLVEDDLQAREGYAEFLECEGFRVFQAGSAEDAVKTVTRGIPDAVVTDIALPGQDGFTLAHLLRDRAETRTVPVVAMTAHWSTEVHERAERAGILSMLLKPCQPTHLVAEVQRALARPRGIKGIATAPMRLPSWPSA